MGPAVGAPVGPAVGVSVGPAEGGPVGPVVGPSEGRTVVQTVGGAVGWVSGVVVGGRGSGLGRGPKKRHRMRRPTLHTSVPAEYLSPKPTSVLPPSPLSLPSLQMLEPAFPQAQEGPSFSTLTFHSSHVYPMEGQAPGWAL